MIYDIIQEIAGNNSRLHKEAILRRESDNELLKRVFSYALDPFRQFYIKKIPAYSANGSNKSLDWALTELDQLSDRIVTGNAGIDHLTQILSSVSSDDAKVIELVIAKDIKCGASETTINKIWKNLIKVYPCMLAAAFDQKLIDRLKYPVLVQEKLDGARFNALVRDGTVEYLSRNGKPIQLNGQLEDTFRVLAAGQNVVFDGELVFSNWGWTEYLDRKTSNGLCNKAMKGTISVEESLYACVELWDMIPLDSFENGLDRTPYVDRFNRLKTTVEALYQEPHRVKVAQTHEAKDSDEIQELFNHYLALGREGVIVKNLDLTWTPRRVDGQIKLKNESVCELRCVGVQEGQGKYTGMIGALICESEDGIIKVSVGSGLRDEDRQVDVYTGKIVSVKYNARIQNKTGEQSLFLPIFETIRLDKDAADSSKDIK